MTESRQIFFLSIFLLVMSFCLYSSSFKNEWTYDDYPVVLENQDIRSVQNFFVDSYPGRPLRELTYLLDYRLFGLEPAGYHLQNILWHGLNGILIALLVRSLGGTLWMMGLAATLFLVHPMQVEVVANISHRKDSLALFFSLSAMLAFLKGYQGGNRKYLWFIAGIFLSWIAYQGKQTAVALLPILACYEFAFIEQQRRILLKKSRLLFMAVLFVVIVLVVLFFNIGGIDAYLARSQMTLGKMNYFEPVTIDTYWLVVLKSLGFMSLRLIWPVALAPEYTYSVPESFLSIWVYGTALLLGGYCFAVGLSFKKNRAVFFGLVWIVFFWLPVSNILPLSYFSADRYLYAPIAGFAIVVVFTLAAIPRQGLARFFLVVVVCFCIALFVLTWRQNQVWRSPEALWLHTIKVSPDSSYALNNVGNIYLLRDELKYALPYYQRSVKLSPPNPTSHYNLGLIFERLGEIPRAIKHYRDFIQLNHPKYRSAREALRVKLLKTYGIKIDP